MWSDFRDLLDQLQYDYDVLEGRIGTTATLTFSGSILKMVECGDFMISCSGTPQHGTIYDIREFFQRYGEWTAMSSSDTSRQTYQVTFR